MAVTTPQLQPDAPVADDTAELSVSAIICAFADERWEWLVEAVASLQEQTVAPLETIVVVDHNDELLDRVRTHMPEVIALPNLGERGAGGARNTGVENARGSIVAFLDDDARAVPHWIERITASLADPSLMGVGGEVKPRWMLPRPPWFPQEFFWVLGCSYRGQPTSPSPVRNLMAGNMAVRREVFVSLGGYRQGHGNVQTVADGSRPLRSRFVTRQSGCEETEFCIRATELWPERIWLYRPDVAIEHRVPAPRTSLRYFLARCNDEGLAKGSVVVRYAGASRGLAAERQYVSRVLPRAVVAGARDGLSGDPWGLARSLIVVVGLAVTSLAYLRARFAETVRRPGDGQAPASRGEGVR